MSLGTICIELIRYAICVYVNPGASLVRSTGGWVARHVLRVPISLCEQPEYMRLRMKHYVQAFRVSDSIPSVQRYCQASSGIEGCRRLDHTINWIFGYS
ncbi:thiazole synthase [Gossypium arboreum]|uniref:Thiazole synthase n=1 Tax=Gossypium arboreum TaxID=29729 RepID=A0A0B0PJA9_GOSAR|nr:thiazole synthase [Gossypium arboreum]KHG24987.1 thiazole synthase [Gossypium arboreum]